MATEQDLAEKKLAAEIAKLDAERADLSAPLLFKSSFWIAMLPTAIAVIGLVGQHFSNQAATRDLLAQITSKTAEATLAKSQGELAIEKAQLMTDKSNWEVSKNKEKLDSINGQMARQNARIKELAAKQFGLFGLVCDNAGAVASAASWRDAEAALDRLGDPEVTLIKTPEIAEAIDALRKKIQDTKGTPAAQPEDLRYEVLRVSNAARTAWEAELKISSFGTAEISRSSLERDFKEHHYKEALAITAKLAQAAGWDEADSARRKFWRLYLGKLVLVENRGDGSVSEAMVRFGDALQDWKSGAPSDEVRSRMKSAAAKLQQACDKDLALAPRDK